MPQTVLSPAGGPTPVRRPNVGKIDRWVSGILGSYLLARSRRRHSAVGRALTMTAGTMLLRKATTGHSRAYDMLGLSSTTLSQGGGMNLESSITVNRPRHELYEFWHDPTNLPRVMRHVKSVEQRPGGVTHWRIEGPRGRRDVEWDAEIINEEPDEFIAWHSMPDGGVEHSGSVHFRSAGDRGTEVHVKMRYVPPAGAAGFAIARALNPITEVELAEDLRSFKRTMETGADIHTEGQPMGPSKRLAETSMTRTGEVGVPRQARSPETFGGPA